MAIEQTPRKRSSEFEPIMEVRNLKTVFYTEKETIRAVDGISFDLKPAETVGIVGESGSGKSVTARSIMGLVESPGRILKGSSIRFNDLETVREFASLYPKHTVDISSIERDVNLPEAFRRGDIDVPPQTFGFADPAEIPIEDIVASGYGADIGVVDEHDFVFVTDGSADSPDEIEDGFVEITHLNNEAKRRMRGGRIAMVFQDPLTSLNPVYTVGNQIKEALRLHQGLSGKEATQEAAELLESVGIPDARRRVNEYPHQFSGGMRQRAVIAMALACEPDVLICDEPTTALDVTIQAQILDLLADLQEKRDLAIMFITHDMGVIAHVSDRVNVMYAGEIVETADVTSLFESPRHPYTEGLLEAIPGAQTGRRLSTIEGNVPTPNEPPTSCRYAPRCPKAFEECHTVHPHPMPVDGESQDHTAACLLYPADESEERAIQLHERLHGEPEDNE